MVLQVAYLLGPESAAEPYRALRVNVEGMHNVFEAARLGGVRRVVYASSVVVHGPQRRFGDTPVDENSPVYPHTPYGAMKWFNGQEWRPHSPTATSSKRWACRLSRNASGFGRATGSSGPWADAIVTGPALGRPVALPVPSSLRTSMLYVDDAAEFLTRLATQDEEPARVYLTGGYAIAVGDLAAAVQQAIEGAEIAWADDAAGPAEVPVYLVDNARVVAATGHRLAPLSDRVRDHITEARAASGRGLAL